MRKKRCFVVIGFGPKVDHDTGRILDLDKSFENLIRPVFAEMGFECFRAKEIRHSGTIDVPMYEWLYKADIVVADLSTLNPNALYELGVRHALKPFTTIVISDDETTYPFDINHTIIERYHHLGDDIGVSEAKRFKKELKKKVKEITERSAGKNDSPVYTFLPQLQPPRIVKTSAPIIKEKATKQPSLSQLLEDAETAKDKEEYSIAAELYKVCLKIEPSNVFLKQRLALVTYKGERPNKKAALVRAEKILKDLKPDESTDPETLGLSGAVNKRLYNLTGDPSYLDRATWSYERGFYIQQDHYNGINLAFLLTRKALTVSDRLEAISYYLQANRVREKVALICTTLIHQKNFKERGDRKWIYQSLAQAYLGLGMTNRIAPLISKIKALSEGPFDENTFAEQNAQLTQVIAEFSKTHLFPK